MASRALRVSDAVTSIHALRCLLTFGTDELPRGVRTVDIPELHRFVNHLCISERVEVIDEPGRSGRWTPTTVCSNYSTIYLHIRDVNTCRTCARVTHLQKRNAYSFHNFLPERAEVQTGAPAISMTRPAREGARGDDAISHRGVATAPTGRVAQYCSSWRHTS